MINETLKNPSSFTDYKSELSEEQQAAVRESANMVTDRRARLLNNGLKVAIGIAAIGAALVLARSHHVTERLADDVFNSNVVDHSGYIAVAGIGLAATDVVTGFGLMVGSVRREEQIAFAMLHPSTENQASPTNF